MAFKVDRNDNSSFISDYFNPCQQDYIYFYLKGKKVLIAGFFVLLLSIS